MTNRRRAIAGLLLLLVSSGCGDTNYYDRTPTGPTPPAAAADTIELRVSGNAIGARVRYSDPTDGLTQITTALPLIVTFTSRASTLFVSLEATPTAFALFEPAPFISVQIVINGSVFREAAAADGSLRALLVSGTWRR